MRKAEFSSLRCTACVRGKTVIGFSHATATDRENKTVLRPVTATTKPQPQTANANHINDDDDKSRRVIQEECVFRFCSLYVGCATRISVARAGCDWGVSAYMAWLNKSVCEGWGAGGGGEPRRSRSKAAYSRLLVRAEKHADGLCGRCT